MRFIPRTPPGLRSLSLGQLKRSGMIPTHTTTSITQHTRAATTSVHSLKVDAIRSQEEADVGLRRMRDAQREYMSFSQKQVDAMFEHAGQQARLHAVELAKFAVEESGIGLAEDKVLKNLYAAEYSINKYKNLKTCGIIEHNVMDGVYKVGEPVGPIVAIVPCTNPTSTVIIKALYAMKTRNCIIFLPHPRTKLSSAYAANLMAKFAESMGAPQGSIQVAMPSREMSAYVMGHNEAKFILATGGPAMVSASYKSGKPAIGVGAGNAPALIDETYDLQEAIASVVVGKTFDWGTICASEQAIIVMDHQYEEAKRLLERRGVYLLNDEERPKLAAFFMPDGQHLNPEVVGKSPYVIAEQAGFTIPPGKVALCVEASEVGPQEVFSHEKLSPIIALYRAKDYVEGTDLAKRLAENGGLGHTASYYTDPRNTERISYFKNVVPAFHLIVNMPASLGAIGIKYNSGLDPSLTLGVGSVGGSISSGNVGPRELLNIKTVAQKMEYPGFFKVPAVYSGRMCLKAALTDALLAFQKDDTATAKDAVVVCDKWAIESETVDLVTNQLRGSGFRVHVFNDFQHNPTFEDVEKGARVMGACKPGLLVALGGGSAIDAAKMMRLHYEYPLLTPENLTSPFIEMRWRNVDVPVLHKKVQHFIAIPTTCGAGAEMTPFTELRLGDRKIPICSYALTPTTVIQDSQFIHTLPARTAAESGFEAFAQAIESYVSVIATNHTRMLARDAASTLFHNLPEACDDPTSTAREKVFYAAGQAGMAFGNTFLGTATAMAMKFGSHFQIPHGAALAIFLPHVLKYNATYAPTRATPFPGYPYPQASKHYAELADALGVSGGQGLSEEEKLQRLIEAIEDIKKRLGLPSCVQDTQLVSEADYLNMVPELADETFGDQLGSTNPRYTLINELRDLYRAAFYGPPEVQAGDGASGGSSGETTQ